MNASAQAQSSLRLFIALPLPEPVLKACQSLQTKLKAHYRELDSPIRWSPPENLHLTLHFLGQTPRQQLPELVLLLKKVAANTPVMTLNLLKLNGFPHADQARVLFWDFEQNSELLNLQQSLGQGLTELGFKLEKREFHPHLTLARFKHVQPVADIPDLNPIRFEATHLMLYQSELHPEGSRYQALSQALFRAQAALVCRD